MGGKKKNNQTNEKTTKMTEKWNGDARKIEDVQQNDIKTAPEHQAARKYSRQSAAGMEREILSHEMIESAPDYAKVKSSASVKSLVRHVKEYHDTMAGIHIPRKTGTDQDFLNELAATNGKVMDCMQEMQAYLTKKAQGYAQKDSKYAGIMNTCAAAASTIRTQRDWVLKIYEKCSYQLRHPTIGMQRKMHYGESYAKALKDESFTSFFQETENTQRQELGSGGINTVYLVDDAERGTERVLKEGQMDMHMRNGAEETVYERIRLEDIKSGETRTMNTAYRDVAVSLIDKLFRLNAAVDTSFAKTKSGRQASLMDKAEGTELTNTRVYMNEKDRGKAEILKQIKINEQYLKKGVDYQLSEKEEKARRKAQKMGIVNMNSAKFMESTFNLSALDIIVGHVDRHAGNMMVTEEGVKGIDNDSSFSLRKVNERFDKATDDMSDKEYKSLTSAINENDGKAHEAMNRQGGQAIPILNKAFPYVTEGFRQKILSVSLEAVEGTLKGLLPEDELQACVARVDALQKYLAGLPDDKILDSFETMQEQYADSYSNERKKDGYISRTTTNIMSQVRSVGGEDYFEQRSKDSMGNFKTYSTEFAAMTDYVKNMMVMDGKKNNELGDEVNMIAQKLMQILAEEASKRDIDLFEELTNGNMVGYYAKAAELVMNS